MTRQSESPLPGVAIDALALADETTRGRGIGNYLQHLLESLGRSEGSPITALADRDTVLPEGIQPFWTKRRALQRLAGRDHAARLNGDAKRSGAGVFHSPGLDPPDRMSLPWVQTLHDVIPLVFRERWRAAELQAWDRIGPRMAQSTLVIANSSATADDGVRLLGLDPERIRVVHWGVDGAFKPPPDRPPVDPPYLVTVGQWDIHKGYAEAFELISRLAELGWPHLLRVVGENPPWAQPIVDELVAGCAHPERVELMGRVGQGLLVHLYQGAAAALVTSRYEGFGLPAVEAMACATPLVAFGNSALPEVIADGGALVADGDVAAMATEVDRLLGDETRWRELSERGRNRAARFDWSRTADRHREVYAEAFELGRGEK